MCALYIVSDRLYVLGGEAVSYRERGAYHDHDHDVTDNDDDDVNDDNYKDDNDD